MKPEHLQLGQQIVAAQERLEQIQQQASNSPSTISHKLLSVVIAELSVALEELSVALEELHQQNEELLENRQILELERQRYQNLFDLAPDAYLVTDEQGIILEANQTAQNLLNVRKDYIIGKPLILFVDSGDHAVIYRQIEKLKILLAETGTNFEVKNNLPQTRQQKNLYWTAKHLLQDTEVSLKPRQKGLLPTAVSLSAERTGQGLVRMYWSFRDLCERKQAEEKIREQAALIDITTDAILVCDLENRILFWNQGAERLYGWTAEESVGKLAHEFFQANSLSQLQTGFEVAIEQGFWQGELEQITKTGGEITVASRWTLVHNLFRQSQCILAVNTDITEKKQLEQQFYRAQRLESVGILASGIAHDLNNVFAPIMMISQLLALRCKNVDAGTQELFQTLEASSERGANLVKQILTFASGTNGQNIQQLQPEFLVQELVKLIQQTFPRSIEIITNIPKNTLWMVQADPSQLEQVFMNLVVNARDAMPNGGTLTIAAENRIIDENYARMRLEAKAGHYIVVTVSDTGTGIPPEIVERIFDPFFTTKEVGKGTGLGLSIVSGVVKNHGGFVEVSTQLGKGTQFQVFLPVAELTVSEAQTTTGLPLGNGELILIVDDEFIIQQATKETLEEHNYRSILANNGVQAISIYSQHKAEISVVLMDIMMPDMDGFMTIQMLSSMNPDIKIIACSGLSTHCEQSLKAGAKAFLSKPYTVKNLLQILSQLIATNGVAELRDVNN